MYYRSFDIRILLVTKCVVTMPHSRSFALDKLLTTVYKSRKACNPRYEIIRVSTSTNDTVTKNTYTTSQTDIITIINVHIWLGSDRAIYHADTALPTSYSEVTCCLRIQLVSPQT